MKNAKKVLKALGESESYGGQVHFVYFFQQIAMACNPTDQESILACLIDEYSSHQEFGTIQAVQIATWINSCTQSS
jgi:hypothetical protein